MTVIEFLKITFNKSDPYFLRQRIRCADGFSVSVQGGDPFHYCIPREHINEYDAVEIGFPSTQDSLIMEYADDGENPTKTVYGYVPIEVAEELILKHGGMLV